MGSHGNGRSGSDREAAFGEGRHMKSDYAGQETWLDEPV